MKYRNTESFGIFLEIYRNTELNGPSTEYRYRYHWSNKSTESKLLELQKKTYYRDLIYKGQCQAHR